MTPQKSYNPHTVINIGAAMYPAVPTASHTVGTWQKREFLSSNMATCFICTMASQRLCTKLQVTQYFNAFTCGL